MSGSGTFTPTLRGPLRWHERAHVRSREWSVGIASKAAIGMLHGLAGTGAVVLLLLASLPSQAEAAAALLVFAPMSVLSMAACTTAFAWVLTRPMIEPAYRAVVIPALGGFGVVFGLWYAGLA
jgi:hypothetical protein